MVHSLYRFPYNTRWSNLDCLKIPPHKTKIYGRQSVNISSIYTWNYLQSHHKNMFHQLSLTRLKKLIMQYYFSMTNSLLSCMYIFVFLFVNFLLLNRLIQHSTWEKSNHKGVYPFILAHLFVYCPPIVKHVSFFISFTCILSLNFILLCSWGLYWGHSINSLFECVASVWVFWECRSMGF